MEEGEGEGKLSLSLFRFHLSPFSPETPDTQASHVNAWKRLRLATGR